MSVSMYCPQYTIMSNGDLKYDNLFLYQVCVRYIYKTVKRELTLYMVACSIVVGYTNATPIRPWQFILK